MDSRAGRVLEDGRRSIVDDEEWGWIVEQARGDFDHLLIATTVPYLLSPGLHHLEAWSEQVCDGAWGPSAAAACEKMRRAVDFDHWASFDYSFGLMRGLIVGLGSGGRRRPTAVDRVSLGRRPPCLSRRGRLPGRGGDPQRRLPGCLLALSQPSLDAASGGDQGRLLAPVRPPRPGPWRASAGAPAPGIGWRLAGGPFFDNQVATLAIEGRGAVMRLEKTVAGDSDERRLECVFEQPLA